MNPTILILLVGVTTLWLGSIALLVVRCFSPKLRGTGWLSAAFAAGSAGFFLLLMRGHPVLNGFCADLGLLCSFVLFHVAVLRVSEDTPTSLWPGVIPLAIQGFMDLLLLTGHVTIQWRIACIGGLIALQSAATAVLLCRIARRSVRAPAIFCTVILVIFGLFNLFRSATELLRYSHRALNRDLTTAAFAMYIAVALGLAFGFFWMTTATLTAELEHIAATDPLTRLFNRRVFLRWCEKELLRSQRSSKPFSVLMVDLDHFKRINDSYGHKAGDEVLCAAVERMQDAVRGIDVLCRWGGEEFAVLLPSATLEASSGIAERIRENIQRATVALPHAAGESGGLYVTVSIGAATYRDLGDDITSMLDRADRALYEAKQSGRNRVLVAS